MPVASAEQVSGRSQCRCAVRTGASAINDRDLTACGIADTLTPEGLLFDPKTVEYRIYIVRGDVAMGKPAVAPQGGT